MELQDIFDTLIDVGTVAVPAADKKAAESMRVMLTRKLKSYKTEMDRVGFLSDKLASSTVGSSFDPRQGVQVLSLKPVRTPKQYEILNVETTTVADVPEDLDKHQERTLQHGSDGESAFNWEEAFDPSSSQGEDDGRSNTEEGWNAYRRSFATSGGELS